MSYGVGGSLHSDLELLWLQCRLAAAAQIQPLAWEFPYPTSVALKQNKTKVWLLRSLFFSSKVFPSLTSNSTVESFPITSLNTNLPTLHHLLYKSIMQCLTCLLNAVVFISKVVFKYNSMGGIIDLRLHLKPHFLWFWNTASQKCFRGFWLKTRD